MQQYVADLWIRFGNVSHVARQLDALVQRLVGRETRMTPADAISVDAALWSWRTQMVSGMVVEAKDVSMRENDRSVVEAALDVKERVYQSLRTAAPAPAPPFMGGLPKSAAGNGQFLDDLPADGTAAAQTNDWPTSTTIAHTTAGVAGSVGSGVDIAAGRTWEQFRRSFGGQDGTAGYTGADGEGDLSDLDWGDEGAEGEE